MPKTTKRARVLPLVSQIERIDVTWWALKPTKSQAHEKLKSQYNAIPHMKPGYFVRMNFRTPELEDDFNRWYNNVHLPDLHKVPGVLSGRRFMAMTGDWKYLALYEFNSKDDMINGRNSIELASAKADTRKRWSAHLDPKAERYWCDIEKVFKESSTEMLFDSRTFFLAFETVDEINASKCIEEAVSGLIRMPEVKTIALYNSIFKEPDNLPNRIFLCQLQDVLSSSAQRRIDEALSCMRSGKELFHTYDGAFYEFMTSIARNMRK